MAETIDSLEEYREKVENSKGIVLVDFYAEWCHPCKVAAPIFDNIAEDYPARVYKVDIENLSMVAIQNNIQTIPTAIFFQDGKPVSVISRALREPSLRRKMEELLSSAQ